MYFLIEDDDLAKKYTTIWDKVSADLLSKAKAKSYGDEVTDFYD